jgi:hypothetical protein
MAGTHDAGMPAPLAIVGRDRSNRRVDEAPGHPKMPRDRLRVLVQMTLGFLKDRFAR